MATFKDGSREWMVAIDAPKIRRIRQALSFDIAATDGTAYGALCADPVLFVDVLYLLCQRQANALKLSDEQFGEMIAGVCYGEAKEAVLEAIIDFFPDQPTKDYLRETAEATEQERAAVMGEALTRIKDPETRQRVAAMAGARMDEALEAIGTRPSSVSNSPGSAE